MFKNKIVLVTGGAGFIGSHIIDNVLKNNCEKVYCIDDFSGGAEKNISHLKNNERFEFIKGDIANQEIMKPLIEKSDVIFNEAASKLIVSLKNPFIDLQTNLIANFNMLETLRKAKSDARIIHASTGSVYGSSEKPFKENDSKNPSTTYGISKLAADNYYRFYAKEYGIKASILRYFHVFGPRQDYAGEAGVISIFLSRVLQGKSPVVFGTGEQIRCFTYVKDDVNANMLLYKNKSTIGKAYNVAAKTRVSVINLAKTIIEKYGNKKLNLKPEMGPHRMGENLKPIPNTQKIENLGFKESISFEDGLDITKKWIEKDIKY